MGGGWGQSRGTGTPEGPGGRHGLRASGGQAACTVGSDSLMVLKSSLLVVKLPRCEERPLDTLEKAACTRPGAQRCTSPARSSPGPAWEARQAGQALRLTPRPRDRARRAPGRQRGPQGGRGRPGPPSPSTQADSHPVKRMYSLSVSLSSRAHSMSPSGASTSLGPQGLSPWPPQPGGPQVGRLPAWTAAWNSAEGNLGRRRSQEGQTPLCPACSGLCTLS